MPTFLNHGIVKLGIAYPDPVRKRAQLVAAGAELTNAVTVRNYLIIVDPDGVIISFLQADGAPVELYTLENASGMIAKVATYGATLAELHVADKKGKTADVVLARRS